jgi:hypothetical protein
MSNSMESRKPTPGEWKIIPRRHGEGEWAIRSNHPEECYWIALLCGGMPTDQEETNRGLICAAPAYFAACEWIEKRLLETGEDLAEVRDVRISALMLAPLIEAHRRAKGGQP